MTGILSRTYSHLTLIIPTNETYLLHTLGERNVNAGTVIPVLAIYLRRPFYLMTAYIISNTSEDS